MLDPWPCYSPKKCLEYYLATSDYVGYSDVLDPRNTCKLQHILRDLSFLELTCLLSILSILRQFVFVILPNTDSITLK